MADKQLKKIIEYQKVIIRNERFSKESARRLFIAALAEVGQFEIHDDILQSVDLEKDDFIRWRNEAEKKEIFIFVGWKKFMAKRGD